MKPAPEQSGLAALLWTAALGVAIATPLHSGAVEDTSGDLVNFSFARYLGTGYYTTDDSDVFVLQLPLTHQLKPMAPDDYGLVLRYPITVGLSDFNIDGEDSADDQDFPEIPDVDDVATISLVPGIEVQLPLRANWYVAPFIDFGFARDMDNNRSSRLFGVGVKSFADFEFQRDVLTLGNRLLYARQDSLDSGEDSSFAVLQSGLDYRFEAAAPSDDRGLDVSLYYINSYYFNDLGIPRALDNAISLSNTNEFGITFGLPGHKWLPDDPRIGFGIQLVDDLQVYRIVFGAPMF